MLNAEWSGLLPRRKEAREGIAGWTEQGVRKETTDQHR